MFSIIILRCLRRGKYLGTTINIESNPETVFSTHSGPKNNNSLPSHSINFQSGWAKIVK